MINRYKRTPFNAIAIIIFGLVIWKYFNADFDSMGWREFASFVFMCIGVIGLIVDLTIQFLSKKYVWIFIIEGCIILLITFIMIWADRTKTLIVSNNPQRYVVIVFGVNNQPKLSNTTFTYSYEIKVPNNGIVLTSSLYEEDLPETIIKSELNQELNTKDSELGWVHFSDEKFQCGNNTFKYKSWIIEDAESCCASSGDEIDSLRIYLADELCDMCKLTEISSDDSN